MRRREVICLIGGAVAAWPFVARAQQTSRMRRVGILIPYPDTDLEVQVRVQAFKRELQRLGWSDGNSVQFDERWTTDNMDRVRNHVVSLVESSLM